MTPAPKNMGLPFCAMVLGPTIMIVGLVGLCYSFHKTNQELRGQVLKAVADNNLRPALKEISENLQKHTKMIDERELEIIQRQQDILLAIQGKKLGELMVKRKKAKTYSGMDTHHAAEYEIHATPP